MSSSVINPETASHPDALSLQSVGLRVTKARLAVMAYLRGQAHPVSHSDLVDALTPQGFDRATLFRNLRDLNQASLVLKDHYGDTMWRYQLMSTPNHDHCHHAPEEACLLTLSAPTHQHPHFVCMTCRKVQCLPTVVDLTELFPHDPASIATVEEIVLRGLCSLCR